MADQTLHCREAFEKWVTTVWRPDDGRMLLDKDFPQFAFAAWKAATELVSAQASAPEGGEAVPYCKKCGDGIIASDPGICGTCYDTDHVAAPKGEAVSIRYFAADPAEGEFDTFDTLDEAKARAEHLLEWAGDAAFEDGWADEPPQICYGIVLAGCEEEPDSRKPAPEGSDFTELVSFRLTESTYTRSNAKAEEVEIEPADLVVEAWPRDPGGMRTYNPRGVAITHKPTGLVVQCSHNRSQHLNRDAALRGIAAALSTHDKTKA